MMEQEQQHSGEYGARNTDASVGIEDGKHLDNFKNGKSKLVPS